MVVTPPGFSVVVLPISYFMGILGALVGFFAPGRTG
jgi:hypothetical protein